MKSKWTQAFRTLQRFAAIVHASKVTALEVFATEAVRRAHNSADFITRAETILNARIRVISGKEEAAMSALGVCSGFLDPAGLVADLGGGSLELVPVSSGKTIHSDRAVSVPCGYLINNERRQYFILPAICPMVRKYGWTAILCCWWRLACYR